MKAVIDNEFNKDSKQDITRKTDYLKSEKIEIDRIWATPNKNTFRISPIRDLILNELTAGVWIDPFANSSKIATITNDLNTEYDTDYHMDALDFLKMFENSSVDGILYDPPYSSRQVSECYKGVGYNVTQETTRSSFWSNHKKEISRIVKPGGKVISFGWNSGGIGKKYGFKKIKILLVPHGGQHNDTICIPKGQEILLHSKYLGMTQSEIELEQDLVIPRENIRFYQGSERYEYSPQYVCGANWETKIVPGDREDVCKKEEFALDHFIDVAKEILKKQEIKENSDLSL